MRLITRLFAVITLIAATGCATAAHNHAAAPIAAGARYVAMGSSFAAGAGIGPTKPGTPARCQRTERNYASLLARSAQLDLVDVTCGGAMTAHVLGAWSELPAQIDAVTADTDLVTITIGGNDIGYVGGLMGGTCRAIGSSPACPPNRAPSEEAYARLEQNLRAIAAEVRARAPHARLVFVEYVTLVPATLCDAALLTPEDAAISRETGRRLQEITHRVGVEAGASVVPVGEISRTHTACDSEPWSNGMSRTYDTAHGAPWHPNAAGMAAIAGALATYLAR